MWIYLAPLKWAPTAQVGQTGYLFIFFYSSDKEEESRKRKVVLPAALQLVVSRCTMSIVNFINILVCFSGYVRRIKVVTYWVEKTVAWYFVIVHACRQTRAAVLLFNYYYSRGIYGLFYISCEMPRGRTHLYLPPTLIITIHDHK
jgi:hypothetical protein